jgi:NADH dehydrogenase (ubiquinone) 1 alpha subcomplex subunit 13
MPPAGGYETIRYKRNLPFRGPGGAVIIGVVTAISAYGFYRVGLGNLEKRYVCSTPRTPSRVHSTWLQGVETRNYLVTDLLDTNAPC